MIKAEGFGRRRLLIIDDDQDWTELLQLYFLDTYDVVAVRPAVDTIEHIRTFRPDALILDLVMPTMDGFGVLQRLSDSEVAKVPIILLTGWRTEDVDQCAYSLGCDAVLAKPVELGVLGQVLSRVIGGGSPGMTTVNPGVS